MELLKQARGLRPFLVQYIRKPETRDDNGIHFDHTLYGLVRQARRLLISFAIQMPQTKTALEEFNKLDIAQGFDPTEAAIKEWDMLIALLAAVLQQASSGHPASDSMSAKQAHSGGTDEGARATAMLVWQKGQEQLRQDGRINLIRICDELGDDLSRPAGAKWADLSFRKAIRHPAHCRSVRTWLSKIIHRAKPPSA